MEEYRHNILVVLVFLMTNRLVMSDMHALQQFSLHQQYSAIMMTYIFIVKGCKLEEEKHLDTRESSQFYGNATKILRKYPSPHKVKSKNFQVLVLWFGTIIN